MFEIPKGWKGFLESEIDKSYFKDLEAFLAKEYEEKVIYPKKEDVLNALKYTAYEDVKIVIIGQDPYHQPNQAHGLSFSVLPGMKIPPSLRNIFKELNSDVDFNIPSTGYLVSWTEQGVLLLNTVLTVRESEPTSHKGKGWEIFTDRVLSILNEKKEPIIFVLWGKHAQSKEKLIINGHHHIIKANHPSPLSASRGFFGSKPFSQINEILEKIGNQKINWDINEENNK
jgi:uracil-DNA glycosylase